VAVICGAGPITRIEVAGTCGAGRPLIAVAGSGDVAGELPEHAVARRPGRRRPRRRERLGSAGGGKEPRP
jgi:hypothetical protein